MATIKQPGKFEGEPSYTPALWCDVLEGCADDEFHDGETPVAVFTVDEALRASLLTRDSADVWRVDPADVAELVDGESIMLWESDCGFVYSRVVDAAELERVKDACIEDYQDDDGVSCDK